MTPAARIAAAADVLDDILSGAPAEKALTGWARGARYAGSGDRAALRDLVFDALRRRRSLAAFGGAETGRGLMIGALRQAGADPDTMFTGIGHAPAPLSMDERAAPLPMSPAQKHDMPDWLYTLFVNDLRDKADAVMAALQQRAPVFVRVNARAGTVDAAMASLGRDGIVARPLADIENALEVTENARKIQVSDAYLSGLVELQDASSQAAMLRMPVRDGMRVLDYCAGGGGKTLAMAARANIDVTAHDVAPQRMADLPARALRAGVAVSRCDTAGLSARPPFDLVLADAPCSGSGSWRRSPDAKWRLTPERLAELVAIQEDVLTAAAGLVRPGGALGYATCSVLSRENGDRVGAFLAAHPGWRLVDEMRWWPSAVGDGFYLAVLQCPE